MADSPTISKKTPASKSMQYKFLRDEGVKHIQKLSGKIWTDYNTHDPGVTILEVLSYAITELGYRATYPIGDLIATAADDKSDIKNFFTARQILPNSAVTIDDYRKLMIDTEIYDPLDGECEHVGVRNAWIQKAKESGPHVYVHKTESILKYEQDSSYVGTNGSTEQPALDIGIMYDILLEFEKCDAYGDLNENTLIETLIIHSHPLDEALEGLMIKIRVEFPRWDNKQVDWEEILSIKEHVQGFRVDFLDVPNGYEFTYEIVNNNVKLTGTITTSSDIVGIPGIEDIEDAINNFIYHNNDSLTYHYLLKISKINQIIDKVKARLNANRNLCEDFVQFNALRVEKIAICADVELETEANIDKVQAKIFHEIARFFSPPVNFYSLDEMLDKCQKRNDLSIIQVDISGKYFLINKEGLSEILRKDDVIKISGSTSNDGEYTVISVNENTEGTKIYVDEDIPSDQLTEGEALSYFTKDKDQCLTVDQVFEGPALDHGFIDDQELKAADRKKYIHVSDLIRIIMEVEGVVAVKSIQIANLPQDNENGEIVSKSVKWCMKLAFDKNYVPRLSIRDSKITYYKNQLPFKASSAKVEKIIDDLEAAEREPRLYDAKLDFEPPRGIYREIENYSTIQNDFPLTYGVGDEGLPKGRTSSELRKAQSKQLKGFLMFFDQLLANYFSQLSHVKDLFSMNAEKDQSGRYIIGRTYYTQPLFDIPGIEELYVDKSGHLVALNNIAEDQVLFGKRKNKFLNHLMARFAEQFTDYALLTFKLTGEERAPEELIEDKLSLLNAYPLISSRRGTAFDHQDPCRLWHVDNIAGVERRVSFLTGIDQWKPERLVFGTHLSILESSGKFIARIADNSNNPLMTSEHNTNEEALRALEIIVINGVFREKYEILSEDGSNYRFTLNCGNGIIAQSEREDFPDDLAGGEADQIIDLLVSIFSEEYYGNTESSRKNLVCPLQNYFETDITIDMVSDPPIFTISFSLYQQAFDFSPANKLLEGAYIYEQEAKAQVDILSVDTTTKKIVVDGNISDKLAQGDILVIENSTGNDGTYTVDSASESGDETTIIVYEVISSDTVPLGELLYNTISETEVLLAAEKALPNFLWEVIRNARKIGQYTFKPNSVPYNSPYVFEINNQFGETLGTSIDKDFNNVLADELMNLISGQLLVSGSTGNDGTYTIISATGNGPNVRIKVNIPLPSTQAGGIASILETYDYTVEPDKNAFLVQAELTGILEKGNTITISGSVSNDGVYQLFGISYDGTNTLLIVEEPIPSDDSSGDFSYSKSFPVVGIDNDSLIVKGGYDLKAVQAMIAFVDQKFFTHEGMHVVEHVLLRPRVRGLHFKEANQDTLTESLVDQGLLAFDKTVDIFSASEQTSKFRVQGDLTAEIDRFTSTEDIASTIKVTATNMNDGDYKVRGVQYDSGSNRTAIRVFGNIITDIPSSNAYGQITYQRFAPVITTSAADLKITVQQIEVLNLEPGDVVTISNSSDGMNDGRYKIKRIDENGPNQELIISQVEEAIEDKLLEVVIDEEECDACKIEDPYTCIASVILPHWQGRFDNMDFRRFFERQIRLETPAHVFLNICWVSCEQMAEFEMKYKAWMVENAKSQVDYALLSAAQNDLVDIIRRLRNIYPVGLLHDCEKDESLENAIILDNSVLGNA